MKRLAALLLLALPFGAAAIAAAVVGLFAWWWYGTHAYPKNLYRAMDKLAAALLGFDGRSTISAECGARACVPCAILCRFLDLIQKGHCQGAAEREGTAPRGRDQNV